LNHQEFTARAPHLISEVEANALLYENLAPFLDHLQLLRTIHHYHPTMIINLDETSCEARRRREPKRLFPSRCTLFHSLSVPPIFHTTILFAVNSQGYPLRSNLILPEDVDLSMLHDFSQIHTLLHQTKRGWMEKDLFRKIMQESLIPDIKATRELLPVGASTRCLLLLDGHSSRVQRNLFVELSQLEIDVLVLPSHTSCRTQPLDRKVNAVWKEEIRQQKLVFPKRKNHEKELLPFVQKLEHCAHRALAPLTIMRGFSDIGIGPSLTTEVLKKQLEHGIPLERTEEQKKRFTICGYEITSPDFLHLWEEHDGALAHRKIHPPEMRMSKQKRFPHRKTVKPPFESDPPPAPPTQPVFEEDDEEISFSSDKPVQITVEPGTTDEDKAEELARAKMMKELIQQIEKDQKMESDEEQENDVMIISKPMNTRFVRHASLKARQRMKLMEEESSDDGEETASESSFESDYYEYPSKRMILVDLSSDKAKEISIIPRRHVPQTISEG
jgi:hypothetical protein